MNFAALAAIRGGVKLKKNTKLTPQEEIIRDIRAKKKEIKELFDAWKATCMVDDYDVPKCEAMRRALNQLRQEAIRLMEKVPTTVRDAPDFAGGARPPVRAFRGKPGDAPEVLLGELMALPESVRARVDRGLRQRVYDAMRRGLSPRDALLLKGRLALVGAPDTSRRKELLDKLIGHRKVLDSHLKTPGSRTKKEVREARKQLALLNAKLSRFK